MWNLTAEYATGSRHDFSLPTRERVRQVKRSIQRVARVSGIPVTFEEGRAA